MDARPKLLAPNDAVPSVDARLAAEAIRVFRRYSVELVEGLGLCPWALSARRDGHVRERVILTDSLASSEVLSAVDALAADAEVEIGILLFPRLDVDRATFERFVAAIRVERPSPFAMAEFHPLAAPVLEPTGAFTSFVRRTPDPTIQLVRQSALEHVRRGENHGSGFFDVTLLDAVLPTSPGPPLYERVLESNRRTIRELGVVEMARRFDDIRRDRDASYAAVGGSVER